MASAPRFTLDSNVQSWPGIGSERAAQLAKLKISTLGDLLLHRPRRYEDRRHSSSIAQTTLAEAATVRGQVVAMGVKWWRQHTRCVFEMVIDDGTGRLYCRWWNQSFMEKFFRRGDEVFVYGKLSGLKPRTIDQPETEVIEGGDDSSIHINRIVPVYPLTENLPQRWLRRTIWTVLGFLGEQIVEPWPQLKLPEMLSRAVALQNMHFPQELCQSEQARQRLALDEFIELQVGLQRRRKSLQENARGLPCGGNNTLVRGFLRQLGFQLTSAQTTVLRTLRSDLAGVYPMRRLVQGDVGSGKTVVAACCALMSIESGFSVALMAPTEILAEQHYQNFRHWFEPMGVAVHLQTGSRKTATTHSERGSEPRNKAISLTIGTHALIESGFQVANLGLVIIDEQHKFGVSQREKLVRKGHYPHLLVMTATPIPRTLGLTLYGDLDISVIDELPQGRGRVKTFVRSPDKLPQVWEFIRKQLAQGRQAYVVYPRVEEDANGVKAVTKEFANLQQQLAPSRLA